MVFQVFWLYDSVGILIIIDSQKVLKREDLVVISIKKILITIDTLTKFSV